MVVAITDVTPVTPDQTLSRRIRPPRKTRPDLRATLILATRVSPRPRPTRSKEFDSRAMRKIDDGQEITFVLETDLAANTAGVNVFTAARLLLKLH